MKWRLVAALLCILPKCRSVICPSGTGAVFLVDHQVEHLETGLHCYRYCASSNCTGVLLNKNWCLSINIDDFYGRMDNNMILRKICVSNAKAGSVVKVYKNIFLDSISEKIVAADDELHCLSHCISTKKFSCKSIMFFAQTRGCFLNSATSSTAKLLNNEEKDFHVVYMERQRPKKNDKCSHSFHTIPWNQVTLRGEAQLVNVSGGYDKCLARCSDNCDYAVYSEYFSECFLISYDPNGQLFDFISEDFQVFENICTQPMERCSAKNAMYISYRGETSTIRKHCLELCIADLHCKVAYMKDGHCTTAPGLKKSAKVIEKYCHESNEADIAVLFEEDSKCMGSEKGMIVEGTKLHECMQLCVTHPTKSCEAVNFYKNGRCRLLNAMTSTEMTTVKIDRECRHFKLNVITFEEKEPFTDHAADVELETICHYDTIIIKVSSPAPIEGRIFPRNSLDNCSAIMNGTEAQLRIPLNSTHCSLTHKDYIYQNVIVVKHNTLTEMSVITEYDKLYRISCDYTNYTANISVTTALQVGNSNYTQLRPPGNIPHTTMKMELRSKRKHEQNKVFLGQSFDLKIDNDTTNYSDLTLADCVASSADGHENITLVENGCATRTALEYIVRGGVKKHLNGFSIPMRAFRFKNDETVKIVCRLDTCDQCDTRTCTKTIRKRSYAFRNESSESEEVEISLIVANDAIVPNSYCVTRTTFISVSSLGSAGLVAQFVMLLKILHNRRSHFK